MSYERDYGCVEHNTITTCLTPNHDVIKTVTKSREINNPYKTGYLP